MLLRLSLPLSLLLVACAAQPPAPVVLPEVLTRQAESASSPVRNEEVVSEDRLPKIDLTADLLLRFIAGDIALQRGQSGFAAKTWLDIAQRTRDPRVARRATELALLNGQPLLALESAQIWAEVMPESVIARQLQISLLIRTNQLAEVEALVPAIQKLPLRELADLYLQLHLLWDRNADREAVARLTGLLTEGKQQMPEAHFALAVMHATQERENPALLELDAALGLRPWWEQAVLYKVQLLNQHQRSEAAIAFLREAIDKNPAQVSFGLALARTLDEAKRPAEARVAYEAVLKQRPDQLEALVGAGLLALQQRDFDAAYAQLSSALMRGPNNANPLRFFLGQIEEERQRLDEALRWYAQTEGGEKTKALVRIAHVQAKRGEREAALKVLALLPAQTEAEQIEKIQLEGQVWRLLKEYGKGRDVLTQAIGRHPNAVDLYYDRSLFSDLLNDLPATEADLRHMLAKQPANPIALNALGYVLANRTDRFAEAEVLLEKAIALEPDNPTIIDSIGWLRFRQGRLQDALTWLARAYGLMADPEIAAHYAEALWQSGEKDKARSLWLEADKRDPGNELLQGTRKRLGW